MMQDSMRVKVKIGSRVKLKENGRRGTVIGIVTLAKDPVVNVKLDATDELRQQELVTAYSLFEPVAQQELMK